MSPSSERHKRRRSRSVCSDSERAEKTPRLRSAPRQDELEELPRGEQGRRDAYLPDSNEDFAGYPGNSRPSNKLRTDVKITAVAVCLSAIDKDFYEYVETRYEGYFRGINLFDEKRLWQRCRVRFTQRPETCSWRLARRWAYGGEHSPTARAHVRCEPFGVLACIA